MTKIIDWTDTGAPRSTTYDDIYFNSEDGRAETEYVFLRGCNLPVAWQQSRSFTVGELGFGTGLNFLVTLDEWRRTRKSDQYLHFVSVEKHPLSPADMRKALGAIGGLSDLAQKLCEQLEYRPTEGFHRFEFPEHRCILTLLVGDVLGCLEELEAQVNCWYLDGFAPAKNPQMWRPEVFTEMARLSAPGAALATFTAAGQVRRDLEVSGFEMRKEPGFGRKRERLVGRFAGVSSATTATADDAPWYRTKAAELNFQIDGCGVAGACIARSLGLRGYADRIYGDATSAASQIPQALVMPRLDSDQSLAATFFDASFQYARRTWQSLELWNPLPVTRVAATDAQSKRFPGIAEFWHNKDPDGFPLVEWQETPTVQGLFFPKAGFVAGPAAIDALIQTSGFEYLSNDMPSSPSWIARGMGTFESAPNESKLIAPRYGQISRFAQQNVPEPWNARGLVGKRYWLPINSESAWVGATFDKSPAPMSAAEDARNLTGLLQSFPFLESHLSASALESWCGVRATSRDRLPIVGLLPKYGDFHRHFSDLHKSDLLARNKGPMITNRVVLTALGARGFTSAPLAAELAVSQVLGDPWPLPRSVAIALAATRFWVRDLRRGKG